MRRTLSYWRLLDNNGRTVVFMRERGRKREFAVPEGKSAGWGPDPIAYADRIRILPGEGVFALGTLS